MEWKRCFFPALCPSASFPCFPTPSGSYHLPGEAKPRDSALPTVSSAERKGGILIQKKAPTERMKTKTKSRGQRDMCSVPRGSFNKSPQEQFGRRLGVF